MSGTESYTSVIANHPDPRAYLQQMLAGPVVAMTGSRACTAYGTVVAHDITATLVRAGATIVTGGGYGIEAEVIRSTLASGGRPVVFLPGGGDVRYPSANAELFTRVVNGGGVLVALQPDGTFPSRERFQERSRAMAQCADSLVIVEAAIRSSALALTTQVTTPVYAVPGPVTSMASSGPHALIRSGRATLLTTDREDVESILTTHAP